MSKLSRFGAYAAAFEQAYASDDWTGIAPFFAANAVYDTGDDVFLGAVSEGRDAILAYMKESVDSLDRRFESRALELLEDPVEEGDTVRLRGKAIYRSAGLPELVLELEEIATYEGDFIVRLEDRFDEATKDAVRRYFETHGQALGIELPS